MAAPVVSNLVADPEPSKQFKQSKQSKQEER